MFAAVILGIINAICSGFATLFLSFSVAIFLGLTYLDIFERSNYSRPVKILTIIICLLFPEIGVFGWAVYFAKNRKFIPRTSALIISIFSVLFQLSYIYPIMMASDMEVGTKLLSGIFVHFIGVPFILIGAVISYFYFSTLDKKNQSNNFKES